MGLHDQYYAENEIIKVLPDELDHARDADLPAWLCLRLDDIQKQKVRLEQAFAKLMKQPDGSDCRAIDDLIGESRAASQAVQRLLDVVRGARSHELEPSYTCERLDRGG